MGWPHFVACVVCQVAFTWELSLNRNTATGFIHYRIPAPRLKELFLLYKGWIPIINSLSDTTKAHHVFLLQVSTAILNSLCVIWTGTARYSNWLWARQLGFNSWKKQIFLFTATKNIFSLLFSGYALTGVATAPELNNFPLCSNTFLVYLGSILEI